MPIARRRTTALFALLATVLAAASLTCGLLDLPPGPGSRMSANEAEVMAHVKETRAALALTQASIALTQTAAAEEAPALPAEPPVEEPQESHVPVITDVDFPTVAPINVQANGMVTFTDAGQDVTTINLKSLAGTFASGSRDATKDITWSGSEGRLPLAGICGRQEFVRSVITLRDAAGNVSGGYTFSFYCQ